ncbi:type II toxin-antitoxin system RelE/ParE family toxin [Methylobacterium haplocladii]|uniref:Plasmid stabilization protein n=1 Tax=Methylobacterium haplocladii TaxID=1176176 RepID=A0A512IR06_9HYPH|nr:type II toxin-antitoxin system RelE/ParE family toxin [Methylobacterium haplocladii]GEP00152.1 plasmid stabilization protein [Methylobacterium haplocladii]GJD82182.1 hypothetical protein HPGCJGGD_0030 [Methylobacterium haplocladii]GLS60773.1 plasmid stabilization protein [Methylobacterium haplocladii]
MRREVVWSPTARADLVAIARYIARDNPSAARTVAATLRAAGEALAEVPTGRPGRVDGTFEKSLPRLPYVIAHELVPKGDGEQVAVLHIIHTSRDWPPNEWPAG